VGFSSTGLSLSLLELRALISLPQTDDDSSDVITNKQVKYKQVIDAIGEKRNPSYVAPGDEELHFDAYANAALGALDVPGRADVTTLAGYWAALLEIENYFAMSIENFETLIGMIWVSGSDWESGYEQNSLIVESLLENAYREKLFSERMADLGKVRQTQSTPAKGYVAMLQLSLGDEVSGNAEVETLSDRLSSFLSEGDLSKLASAQEASRWGEVERLLAHAMFVRRADLAPRKVTWLNAYPADDARAVLSTRGTADASGALPFLPFGAPVEADPSAAPPPLIGFALTSPILSLSGGKRTITLTLGLRGSGYEFERLKAIIAATYGKVDAHGRTLFPLIFEVSTEKGWVRCSCSEDKPPVFDLYDTLLESQNYSSTWHDHAYAKGMRIVLTLPEGEVAIAPLGQKIDGMDPRWPALRVLMQPVWSAEQNRYVTYYRELASVYRGAAHIQVEVAGLLHSAL
jgi:hypothetical protein